MIVKNKEMDEVRDGENVHRGKNLSWGKHSILQQG